MKEKKGIGFAKLIIGIIVIIVVVIFGVSYVKKIIDKEKIKNVRTFRKKEAVVRCVYDRKNICRHLRYTCCRLSAHKYYAIQGKGISFQ